MPFGDYADFDDCVAKNADKEDPEAYCATIKREIEGKEIGGWFKELADKVIAFVNPMSKAPPPPPAPPLMQAANSGFTVTKDAKGDLRWFGFVSGNFKDRDKEIFPADVHEEFITYLDQSKDYPELRVWHTPDTRFGKADWAEFDHGFLMMTGTIDKGKEHIAEAVAAMPDQGMSHGFKFHYREPGVIGFYRTFEVSVLPLTHAAFPWTNIQITKEMSMKPEKRAYLESVLGKERVMALIDQAGTLQKNLVAAGVDWKEFDPAPPEPKVEVPPVVAFKDTEEYKVLSALPEQMEKLTKTFGDVTAIFDASIKALQDENKVLKDQVSVKANDMLAQLLRPRAGTPATPASKSSNNVVPPDSPLAQAKPKLPVNEGLARSLLSKL